MRAVIRLRSYISLVRLGISVLVVSGAFLSLTTRAAAQITPVELLKTDITKLKTLDSSQWTVLGVRLGDAKETALKTLRGVSDIKVQDDPASGRIFVSIPPPGSNLVMSVKITQGLVTGISIVGGFGEWLQGDSQLLFRAFEDDSLRYRFLGREDQRETLQGGTKESPTVTVTYAYFKEGLLLVYAAKQSADGKQVQTQREMMLIYPAKSR